MSRGNQITRRKFLGTVASTAAAVLLPKMAAGSPAESNETQVSDTYQTLPKRVLGRTKERVSILGLGTAPVGEGPVSVQDGIRIFGEAIDRGVTYVDTARIYGEAEEILGHIIPSRRDKLFIATKVSTDNAIQAEQSLSQSLRTLRTDHVDVVHIHSTGTRNLDKVLAKDGVLEYLLKQKQAGKLRFIGISGHNRPGNFLRMLETDQIDVVMCVMNYADRNIYNFEGTVLAEAKKRNIGCVAMKVYAGIKGGFPNHGKGHIGCVTEPARMPYALAYALDLEGVSVAVIGPYTVAQAKENVEFALRYKPLTAKQREELLEYGKKIAPDLGPRYGSVT
jgi:predicted aldo/keto reductase-like oxidoreductase